MSFSLAIAVVDVLCLLHSTKKLFVQIITSWQSGYIRSQHESSFNLWFHIYGFVEEVRVFSYSVNTYLHTNKCVRAVWRGEKREP